MDCIFCKLIDGQAPVSEIYRNDRVLAFMDIQPVNPGHVLVIPLQHSAYIEGVDPETGAELFRVGQQMAAAIRCADPTIEGINLFLADGEAAGQEVFHAHLHVIPRFTGDGFGMKFGPDNKQFPPRPELDRLARLIADHCQD